MTCCRFWIVFVLAFLFELEALAQAPSIPPGEKEPVLRLEAGGPTSFVTSLAFNKDGTTLYAAGFDKVVRLWNFDARADEYVADKLAYRVPLNPGLDGAINATALSPGGNWLAVAGNGVIREGAGFRQPGLVVPVDGGMTAEMWEDRGMIYVFNTKKPQDVILLRGHKGAVVALAFAPPAPDKEAEAEPPPLVSIVRERDLNQDNYARAVGVWDVVKGTKKTHLWNADTSTRPGLSVWRTGNQPDQLYAAFAWGDGSLHLWDVEHDKPLLGENEGKTNASVVVLPKQQSVLTGSFQKTQGRLRVWKVPPGEEPEPTDQGASLPPGEQTYYFPLALTLFASQADGKPDHVAVVSRRLWLHQVGGQTVRDEQDGLSVYSLADFRVVTEWFALWPDRDNVPVIAAAPRGKYLAVAGNDDHDIAVFTIQDLLEGKQQRKQILQSVGARARYVCFVENTKELGLLLNEQTVKKPGVPPRKPRAEDLVFDVGKRTLTAYAAAWKISSPAPAGWQAVAARVQDDPGKEPYEQILIRQDEEEKQRVKFKPRQRITDYALLPPCAPLQIPILAVAFVEQGLPYLHLYNAATGDQLRTLVGHTAPIRGLAFSGDGRLMASVAEDQTLCIWSLTTLHRSLGVRGLLKGLAVKGLPAVGAVAPNSPEQGRLKPDDLILGIKQKDRLIPLHSVRAVAEALFQAGQGNQVVLRVQDSEGRTREVSVTADDGPDDRKAFLMLGAGLPNALAILGSVRAAQTAQPLRGITLKTTLQVVSVDAENTALKGLARGDVIEGLVIAKKLQPLPSARQFYETIQFLKPKSLVPLRIRGKGDINLAVGQAIYEWKPLVFFFITRPDQRGDRAWIGWNPNGHYESSTPNADRLIGWHFNTGDPQQPTRFATADQYRKEYYREGILRHLIAAGSLAPALKAWENENRLKPLPQPRMTLWLEDPDADLGKATADGPVLVRRRVPLKIAIDDFPLERIDLLEWQFDDQPAQRINVSSATLYTADLPATPWTRGEHKIRLRLRTQEEEPQEYVQELTLRYQPPRPVIQSKLESRLKVENEQFTVQATVEPGQPGDEVQVSLSQRQNNKEVVPGIRPQAPNIDQQLKLKPGENWIELVAVNKDALPGHEEAETERMTWVVTYAPPAVKVPPPQLALTKVVPLVEGKAAGTAVDLKPGSPLVVEVPNVRLVGWAKASEKLAQLEWSTDEVANGQALSKFDPDKVDEFTIGEVVKLTPGVQTIHLSAKTANSESAVLNAVLDYRPALPKVDVKFPAQGLVLYEGTDNAEVAVEGSWTPPADLQEYSAALVVNGRQLAEPKPLMNEAAKTLTAKIPLQIGNNQIQIRLWNRWKAVATTETILVRYLRPPRITQFEGPAKSDKPLVNLVARVTSPLPLKGIEAQVKGREISTVEVVPPAKDAKEPVWTVKLQDVPLEEGDNPVQLWVSNAEARSRQPGNLTVAYTPPAKPPSLPEVELLEPHNDTTVTDVDLPVRIRVRSDSPLKQVELIREGTVSLRRKLDLSRVQPDALGFYELKASLRLEPHANQVRVEALNAGGAASSSVVVNYLQIPVLLDIEGIQVKGQDKLIRPERLHDGKLKFPMLPGDWMVLKGYITGSKQDEESFRAVNTVRVCVNGFQQLPVPLDPPVDNRRTFETRILLNRAENNQIEISLPDLKQDAGNRQQFALDTLNPAVIHRVHVLIVGVDEKDEKKLIRRMLQTLEATATAEGRFTTPLFGQGRNVEGQLYGPLTDRVTPDKVLADLYRIKRSIDRFALAGAVNDVVMVYYVGSELVTADGHYFLTDRSTYDPVLRRSAIPCDGLVNHFAETLGAQLLWLDVSRPEQAEPSKLKGARDRIARWLYNPHVGVMRFAWRGPANRPEDAWLITDLRSALAAKAPTLGKAALKLATLFKWEGDRLTFVSCKYQENLTYNPDLPGPLADFGIGGK